jgi:hypothetical protein
MRSKVLVWVAVIFLMFYVTSRPAAAARTARGIGNAAAGALGHIADFFVALVS